MAEGARLESVFRGNSNVGSNPTLSAMLLKINKLRKIKNPLSASVSFFGMSDMQFCRAQVRAVKAKTDLVVDQFFNRQKRNFADQVGASAGRAPNKKPHRTLRRLRLMLAGSLLSSLGSRVCST